MKNKALHISQNELWASSEKAVRGFTNSMFHGFFRDEDVQEAWERLDERLGLDRPADAQLLENEAEESLTAQVPAGRSRAILGYLLEGLDDGEIADRLGISKAAAYTAICRVRKEVRRAA